MTNSAPTDYSATVRVNASPDQVFDAITRTEKLGEWWHPATGSGVTGGELRFKMDAPEPLVIHVDEASWPEAVRWTVTDCPFLPDWVGTRPTFTITPIDQHLTELHFHHEGLHEELECIGICRSSWNHYIIASLRDYLEKGVGSPIGSIADNARRQAEARQ